MADLNSRILHRAIALQGGTKKLATELRVKHEQLLGWAQGRRAIPASMLEKLLDIVLAADVASLTGEGANAEKGLLRVLVVDDDDAAAYALARIVKSLGYEVKMAASGREALETARDFRPQLVFVDLRMPDMDGSQVAAHLKAEGLGTHIVAATAYPAELERQRTTAFAAHLVKPVDQRSLQQLLTSLH
jgi:CheY-like chemotaxis protein